MGWITVLDQTYFDILFELIANVLIVQPIGKGRLSIDNLTNFTCQALTLIVYNNTIDCLILAIHVIAGDCLNGDLCVLCVGGADGFVVVGGPDNVLQLLAAVFKTAAVYEECFQKNGVLLENIIITYVNVYGHMGRNDSLERDIQI